MRAISALVFLALAGSATAAIVRSRGEIAPQASAIAAEGSLSFANSRGDMPIFSVAGIAPGDSTSGMVEIANVGSDPGQLELTQHDVADIRGSGGGKLSSRLTIRVTDVTPSAKPLTIYAGPLAPMPPRAAGQLQPGESRTYEFVATLPAAGPAAASTQNDLQGASTSVAYSWIASEPTKSPQPPPPSSPPPTPPSSPPPAPPPSPTLPPRLHLSITGVRHTIRHGRLLVRARCNSACAIYARGRLRAVGPLGRRRAKLRPTHRPPFVTGAQRVSIRIPRHLRRWLDVSPKPPRVMVRLFLRARDPAGQRATARRAVRVREPRGPRP